MSRGNTNSSSSRARRLFGIVDRAFKFCAVRYHAMCDVIFVEDDNQFKPRFKYWDIFNSGFFTSILNFILGIVLIIIASFFIQNELEASRKRQEYSNFVKEIDAEIMDRLDHLKTSSQKINFENPDNVILEKFHVMLNEKQDQEKSGSHHFNEYKIDELLREAVIACGKLEEQGNLDKLRYEQMKRKWQDAIDKLRELETNEKGRIEPSERHKEIIELKSKIIALQGTKIEISTNDHSISFWDILYNITITVICPSLVLLLTIIVIYLNQRIKIQDGINSTISD